MTERLLQFIWQFQYFNTNELTTEQGDPLRILYPGLHNINQGPDFLQGKIQLDKHLWAGNIELHLKTSDWYKHRHHKDKHYKNIILHVVWENDQAGTDLYNLPTLELQSRISNLMLDRYEDLMLNRKFVPCENNWDNISSLIWTSWKDRLLIERLERKSQHIFQLLEDNNYNWEETLWWMLARNFGITINADTFEAMARSIPSTILGRHRSQIHQLEALLFGQAGLLNRDFEEDYPTMLRKEYQFLATKYQLKPINLPVLFLRMRPFNFPSIRLAQLAMLIQNSRHLFSKIKETRLIKDIGYMLEVTANDYWHYHYRFDELKEYRPKTLGMDMIHNIMINTLIPMLFTYGVYHDDQPLINKALSWVEEVPSEKNNIIEGWDETGIASRCAYDSQALIELKTQYCDKRRCLDCAIGNAVLKGALRAVAI